jgi:transposase
MTKPNAEVNILPQVEKACGLDMHKDKIVCFISNKDGTVQHMEEFGTFSEHLFKVRDLIVRFEVERCLMESTGVYWISLYGILTESGVNTIVANPQHIKQIPKRKTDRKDARWLCTLALYGLARQSFVPGVTQQALRDLCRNRLFYKQGQTRIKSRMIKILERANIKIRSVASDISTKSAIGIIRLLAAGITDIDRLAACCRGRLKAKKEQMKQALAGTLNQDNRMMLHMLLADLDHYQSQIDQLEKQINNLTDQHYKDAAIRLRLITGIGEHCAHIILSEIGDNMDLFPTADNLTSWCGLAPGNNESAGKRRGTAVKKGNKYLRIAMITVAWGAVRTKDSYWKALFEKLRKRMKAQKAIVVVARRLLIVIYKTIKNETLYVEKGFNHFLDIQEKNLNRQKSKLAI